MTIDRELLRELFAHMILKGRVKLLTTFTGARRTYFIPQLSESLSVDLTTGGITPMCLHGRNWRLLFGVKGYYSGDPRMHAVASTTISGNQAAFWTDWEDIAVMARLLT